MKHSTNQLTGHRLAYALAVALGRLDKQIESCGRLRPDVWISNGKVHVTRVGAPDGFDYFKPDADDNLIIDLVNLYRIEVKPAWHSAKGWTAWILDRSGPMPVSHGAPGDTVSLAVARCVVQWEIGPDVDIPEEIEP